jgi:hypothetical protein
MWKFRKDDPNWCIFLLHMVNPGPSFFFYFSVIPSGIVLGSKLSCCHIGLQVVRGGAPHFLKKSGLSGMPFPLFGMTLVPWPGLTTKHTGKPWPRTEVKKLFLLRDRVNILYFVGQTQHYHWKVKTVINNRNRMTMAVLIKLYLQNRLQLANLWPTPSHVQLQACYYERRGNEIFVGSQLPPPLQQQILKINFMCLR